MNIVARGPQLPATLPGPPAGPAGIDTATPRFALRAARAFDGHGGPPRSHPLVVVEDGLIVAVDDAEGLGDPGCFVVDLGDASLLPGLIDSHIHLAWLDLEDADVDHAVALLQGADHASRTLAGGVTSARDLGGPGDVPRRLRDAIADGVTPGPRLLVAGAPLTTPQGHCHWLGRTATTEAEVREAVSELAASGVDVVKVMLTGGMVTPSDNPFALQYSQAVAAAAVDEAHHVGLPVAGHALGTAGVRAAVAAGIDTLEHGWTITGREQRYEPEVIDELRGTSMVASVSAHYALRELLPDAAGSVGGGDPVELERRLVPHRAVAAAGVSVVVHSDAGVGPTRFEAFGESLEVFAAGMHTSAAAAIHAATLAPARALGLAGWLGSLQVGRVADIVSIQGDPEVDLRALRRVGDVYQGGRLVARDGALVAYPTPVPGPT